ncbi:MAG: mitofilin family membrane protein [Pseudomonadota bacterium]
MTDKKSPDEIEDEKPVEPTEAESNKPDSDDQSSVEETAENLESAHDEEAGSTLEEETEVATDERASDEIAADDQPDTTDIDKKPDEVEDAVFDEIADDAHIEASAVKQSPISEPKVVVKKAGGFTMLVGGLAAAIAGFFAARFELIDPYLPEQLRSNASVASELQIEVNALRDQLADLGVSVAALQDAPPPEIPDYSNDLTTLNGRVAALEERPVAVVEGDNSAVDAAVDELLSTAATQQAEIERLLDNVRQGEEAAAQAKRVALARTAVAQINSAIGSGEPFEGPLSALQDSGALDRVPEGLTAAAQEGVTTLAQLQAEVADAARSALAVVRSDEQGTGGVGAFLQRQLGARSVTPKQGDDADAVLSRMEAAVRSGDLGTALDEASGLPEKARGAMSGWLGAAETRHNAQSALDALTQQLSSM